MNGYQQCLPSSLHRQSDTFSPTHALIPPFFADGRMADIISGFWVGDAAFSILKKCLNPNQTHELLLLYLAESKYEV